MVNYNEGWEPYRIGSHNGESYYKRYTVYWVRRTSSLGGDLRDRLEFSSFSRPVGLA